MALLLVSCDERQDYRDLLARARNLHGQFAIQQSQQDEIEEAREECSAKLEALTRVFPPERSANITEADWALYCASYLAQVECIRLTKELYDSDHPVTDEERETLLSRLSEATAKAYRF